MVDSPAAVTLFNWVEAHRLSKNYGILYKAQDSSQISLWNNLEMTSEKGDDFLCLAKCSFHIKLNKTSLLWKNVCNKGNRVILKVTDKEIELREGTHAQRLPPLILANLDGHGS